jgi:hypothetical protein
MINETVAQGLEQREADENVQPIQLEEVVNALKCFEGQRVYVHFELTRGGFIRNLAAQVVETHLRGEGSYRVALRCQEDGWVIMEGLTHVDLTHDARLFLYALDTDQRLSQALQLSLEPFAS